MTAASAASTAASLLPARVTAKVHIDDAEIQPVLSLSVQQHYGEHHRLTLRCYADSIQATTAPTIEDKTARLLGHLAEVTLQDTSPSGGSQTLQAKFIINDISLEQGYMGKPVIRLIGYSPTWLLDDAPSYESFCDKNLEDIARICTKGMEKAGATLKASTTFTAALPYLCRWRESNWNFLKRISAGSGQWLYFNGQDLVFGLPEKSQAISLVYGHNCDQVSLGLATSNGAPAYTDYDAAAHKSLQGKVATGGMSEGGTYGGMGVNRSKNLFETSGGQAGRETVGPLLFPVNGRLLDTVVSADQGAHSSSYYIMRGESTVWRMTVGSVLEVSFEGGDGQAPYGGHPGMRVIGVEHHIDGRGNYKNSFIAQMDSATFPPALSYEQPHTHKVLAEVLSNADPMSQGRVQVKMLGWVQCHSQQRTDWIRVMTPDAGGTERVMKNRGQLFIPEVGDEVLLDFIGNNPDRPFVAGSMYHSDNASSQGGKDNMLKSITTRSGHRIDFDDTDGGTSITITDRSGNTMYFDTQGSNITITAPETMTLNSKNMNVNVTEDMNVSVGRNKTESIGKNSVYIAGKNFDIKNNDMHIEVLHQSKTVIMDKMEEYALIREMQVAGTTDIISTGLISIKSGTGVDYSE